MDVYGRSRPGGRVIETGCWIIGWLEIGTSSMGSMMTSLELLASTGDWDDIF